jgi:hypothetical protein
MPTQLQLRGGTTLQNASFTGLAREVTVDTTQHTGTSFESSTVTLPTGMTTTRSDVGFIWNAATSAVA